MKKKKKFYTVWVGRNPGVYNTWDECKEQIHGFQNAVYKSFSTLEQAEEALKNDNKNFIGIDIFESSLSLIELETIGNPLLDSICVDGAWNTQTHEIEYQGIYLKTSEKVFHFGPVSKGTNNIAEFLGLVHALAYCKNHLLDVVIYSDSQTAISWVKKKKAATKIEIDEYSRHVLSLVQRAEEWLKANDYKSKI
jgi:ribonuclease HI